MCLVGFVTTCCKECPDGGNSHSHARSQLCHTSFSTTDQNKPDLLYGMSRANTHKANRFPDIAAESRLCNPHPITFLGIFFCQCSQFRLNVHQFVYTEEGRVL